MHRHHNREVSSHGKKRRAKVRILFGAAAVLLTLALIFIVGSVMERSSLGTGQSDYSRMRQINSSDRPANLWSDADLICFGDDLYGIDHRVESFLFVGTDSTAAGADAQSYRGGMADFLLLMVLDYTDDTYGYLQIDRNTVTDVRMLGEVDPDDANEYSLEQICTAHWYGANPEESRENLVLAVSDLLGELENISGTYILNMDEIALLNDAVGGVAIDIPEDLTAVDPAFREGAHLTLTGDQAEAFLRARMAVGTGSNTERMSRQRIFMKSFFAQVREKTSKDARFPLQLWNTLSHAGSTDMNGNAFSRIGNMLLTGEDQGMITLDGEVTVGTVLQDGLEHEEFYPDQRSILAALNRLYSLVYIEDEEDTEDWEDLEEDSEDWEDLEEDSEDWG